MKKQTFFVIYVVSYILLSFQFYSQVAFFFGDMRFFQDTYKVSHARLIHTFTLNNANGK